MPGLYQLHTTLETAAGDWRAGDCHDNNRRGWQRVAAKLFIVTLLAFPVTAPRPGIALMSQLGAAGVLELAGGTLMLVGLFSRPVAFVAPVSEPGCHLAQAPLTTRLVVHP